MKPDELIAIRRKLRMERWERGEAVGYTGAAWCYVATFHITWQNKRQIIGDKRTTGAMKSPLFSVLASPTELSDR